MVSRSCLDDVGDRLFRDLGVVAVEGKEERTRIYEVLEDPNDLRREGYADLAEVTEKKLASKPVLFEGNWL